MAWIDNKKAYDVVLLSWINDSLKTCKIADEVIMFMGKKTWKTGMDSRRKTFYWGKNPERYLPGRCAIIITICNNNGYNLTKLQEKINHPMYRDVIKLFAKNEKDLKTLTQAVRIYMYNIGMEFSIEEWAMLIMRSGKRQMKEGTELPNQEKIRTLEE